MTTLGTHPFIPAAFRLGSAPVCQRCPNEASHPVHDWLTASASWYPTLAPITPEEMVQLPNLLTGYESPVEHTKDSDCTIGPDGLCVGCGVDHNDECLECGGRGFHKSVCVYAPLTEAEYAEAYPDGNPRTDIWGGR